MNQVELEQYAKTYTPELITDGELAPRGAYGNGYGQAPAVNAYHDGDKFFGGFGPTKLFSTDYWTLRKRSDQLFKENLYARGLIRRLITNEINTGLTPEACPDELLIGLPEESLNDWTEEVENRFLIWGKNPEQCDWKHRATFGAIQRAARMEALISGDVLVVLRQNRQTQMPMVQLVSGAKVQTPLGGDTRIANGHTIRHGVELDAQGRTAAYWVKPDDGTTPQRIPAKGPRSGRRMAWLVYGTEKRLDDVRGEPLLSLVLQSLKEIDRYRDSVQRKAVINSILAMFIKKTEDKQGTRPITGGAVRRGQVQTTDLDGGKREFNIASQVPGLVIEELQTGEEPVLKGGEGTDTNFGTFEEAIVQAVAWANEVPPEILRLAFSNNYSASQAAINEFKIYLNKVWADWGETFCQPVYIEWLLAENLKGRISAPGLLDAWRDPQRQDVFGAWVSADWYGSIKPSTDMKKQAQGSQILIAEGWSNNARESRTLTGTKFSKNMKRLKRENQMKADAARPLAEFEQEFGQTVQEAAAAISEANFEAQLDEYLDDDREISTSV